LKAKRVIVPELARLPAFCHATVAGDFIFVSGTLGTLPGSMQLAPGGVAGQTTQTLRNIETILQACGAGLDDLVKVNVFLADIDGFAEMNEAYLAVMGDDPPARITVGKAGLALGPAVEIDAITYLPQKGGRE
jgi:2-iminobutanoate/2-iminopropanoate deaminase